MKQLHLDFESKSELDLDEVGLDRYIKHESTRVLMCAYAFDDDDVVVVEGEVLPAAVRQALADPTVQKIAWNCTFEIAVLLNRFGIEINYREWLDVMIWARYLGFPGKLEYCPEALGVSARKNKRGKDLIKKFCTPAQATQKMQDLGYPPIYWRDASTDPDDWAAFVEYCRGDVITERACLAALETYPAVPAPEWNLWRLDQQINDRGISIDVKFVHHADAIIQQSDETLRQTLKQLTGIDNVNSCEQTKGWLLTQGVSMNSIDKDAVNKVLAQKLPPLVRQVLELRKKISGSATKKFAKIKRQISEDNRLRHQIAFYVASTGRFAGRGVQPHNLARPDRSMKARIAEITESIRSSGMLPPGLDCATAITSVIRSSFWAEQGHHFVIADFSSIENRVLAWLAVCHALIETYRLDRCPYRECASILFGVPYDQVTEEQRNKAKIIVLGGGFGLGVDGLLSSAADLGVSLTEEEAKEFIRAFRASYPEIPTLWKWVERLALAAIRDRSRYELGHGIYLDGQDARFLKIDLPSNRSLFYLGAKVVTTGSKFGPREQIEFRSTSGGPLHQELTYGAKLIENIVQALSRDILCLALLRASKAGFEPCLHVHDEIVATVPDGSPLTHQILEQLMSKPPAWALTLLLKAEGHESAFYSKGESGPPKQRPQAASVLGSALSAG